jgi:predicted PurR-regulated permease PerM
MTDNRGTKASARLFLILVTIGLAIILYPFWKAIFWAVVFTILFSPLQKRLAKKLGDSGGAILIVLLILFFVLIPGFLVAGLIADGAILLISNAKTGFESGSIDPMTALTNIGERFPSLFSAARVLGIDLQSIREAFQSAVIQFGQFVLSILFSIGQSAAFFGFQLLLILYLTFALLCYGHQIHEAVFRALPLDDRPKRTFANTFASMAAATLKGTAAVGIVQGILGTLIFWLLGLNSAVFWGAVMGLLSVVPPFGAGFVWAPAAAMLALQGDWAKGLMLFAYGTVIISMSDNVVRPILVGRASSVPHYLVLLTTLGGLISFGITGLVLGPVIAALFLSAWQLQTDEAD